MTTEASLAYGRKILKDLGISDEVFYGIAGSLMGESGRSLNTAAYNPKDPGGARGIAQWLPDRWATVQRIADDTGRDVNSYEVQWDAIKKELLTTENRTLERLQKAQNRQEATTIWTNSFERPNQDYAHHDRRAANTEHVAELFGSGVINQARISTAGDAPTTLSTSLGGDGINEDPMTNPLGYLTGLGNAVTGKEGGIPEPRGPITPGQTLALALGGFAGGEAGMQIAASLYGAGNEPKDLSMSEGVAMGIGGLIGGIPGAVIGQSLGTILTGLFAGKGMGAFTDGSGSTPPFNATDGSGTPTFQNDAALHTQTQQQIANG